MDIARLSRIARVFVSKSRKTERVLGTISGLLFEGSRGFVNSCSPWRRAALLAELRLGFRHTEQQVRLLRAVGTQSADVFPDQSLPSALTPAITSMLKETVAFDL